MHKLMSANNTDATITTITTILLEPNPEATSIQKGHIDGKIITDTEVITEKLDSYPLG